MRLHRFTTLRGWLTLVGGLSLGLSGARADAEPAREPALTAEQQHQLQERNRLWAEAQQLRTQDKLAEAATAAEKALGVQQKLFGNRNAGVVTLLDFLAQVHEQREDFPAARKARRQVLDLQTQLWGGGHWRVTDARRALADTERLRKLPRADRARLREATSLNDQVYQLRRAGRSEQALPLAQRATALLGAVLGKDHPTYALSLFNLADQYKALAAYAQAEPLYHKALAIVKQALGEQHPAHATCLNSLAVLYKDQGDYARALPLLKQALAVRKQALGEQHPTYAASLNNLAALYKDQGDYARALPLFKMALAIQKQALGAQHPHYAASLNNLALLYQAQGEYVRAEPLFCQALAIRKQALGEHHPDYASFLSNLALLYKETGDYARAEPLLKQVLAIRKKVQGEQHADYASSLNNLATLYQAQRDYAQALPLYRKALAIIKQALGEQHPHYATSLNNVAGLYYAQGDHVQAEPLLLKARAIWKQALGEQHPHYAASLINLALLYQAQGDYARAEPLFRQALALRKQALGEHHPDYALSLNNLAHLYLVTHHPRQAERHVRQAVQVMSDHLDLTAAAQSERQQLAALAQGRIFLDHYLTVTAAARIPADPVYARILAWKGAVSARQRYQRQFRRALQGGVRPEVARLYAELARATGRLAALSLAPPDPKRLPQRRRDLEQLSDQVEGLQKALAAASVAFRQQLRQRRRTAADLQQALPAGTALVDLLEYGHHRPPPSGKGPWTGQRRLAAFVVRLGQPVRRLDLGPVKPIAAALAQWRGTLTQPAPVKADRDPAATLRRLVWQPLAKHLAGVQTVLVSPDGALNGLPLAALPGTKAGTYLIEEVALAVLPVPQLLPELLAPPPTEGKAARQAAPPSLLLVGDVDFDAAPGPAVSGQAGHAAARGRSKTWRSFAPLKGTRGEVLEVEDSFKERFPDGRVKVLRKGQATEAAVRQLAPQHRFVHLATHGFFAPPALRSALAPRTGAGSQAGGTEPEFFGQRGVVGFHPGLLSGLVLAGANRPPHPEQDDGILTALEVAELDLAGVDLAVLSACETGLGESAGGEGLLGLQRAFQVAGARSVVASLWKVDDRATRELMTRFYHHLWTRKLSRLEALRQAQLWMLREGSKRGLALVASKQPRGQIRTPPLYWAAFQLSGDWR